MAKSLFLGSARSSMELTHALAALRKPDSQPSSFTQIMTPDDQPASWAKDIIATAIASTEPYELIDTTTPKYRFLDGCLPIRPSGVFSFDQHAGFVDYVKNHGQANQVEVWGSAEGVITAVLDGHSRGTHIPGWGIHRAVLNLETTPEWVQWQKIDKRELSQTQLAEFLDDNLGDVVQPDAATLLETVSSLTVATNVGFTSGIDLKTGEVELRYTEEQSKGSIRVPSNIILRLSPFLGCQSFQVEARLRYRINAQKLTFKILIDRPHLIERTAFDMVCEEISKDLELMVYRGSPPSSKDLFLGEWR
jgi:uncharacterized protein YfdQ (DUF2303 family)